MTAASRFPTFMAVALACVLAGAVAGCAHAGTVSVGIAALSQRTGVHEEDVQGEKALVFDKGDGVNGLVEKLGAEKSEVVFVGDMVHDIETARHGGIKSVAVLSGHNTRERLLRAKPDYCIESVKELPLLIEEINGEMA